MGFDAFNAVRSGLDDTGMGGGDAVSDCTDGVALGLLFGNGGRPGSGGGKLRAPLILRSGALSIFGWETVGRSGNLGSSTTTADGLLFGNGGREDGSYSGAKTRCLLPVLPVDRTEATDSTEVLLRLNENEGERLSPVVGVCADGRRGGRLGTWPSPCADTNDVCEPVGLRGGNCGRSSTFALPGVGGGRLGVLAWLTGLCTLNPLLAFVFVPFDRGGRLGSGGGGRFARGRAGAS